MNEMDITDHFRANEAKVTGRSQHSAASEYQSQESNPGWGLNHGSIQPNLMAASLEPLQGRPFCPCPGHRPTPQHTILVAWICFDPGSSGEPVTPTTPYGFGKVAKDHL